MIQILLRFQLFQFLFKSFLCVPHKEHSVLTLEKIGEARTEKRKLLVLFVAVYAIVWTGKVNRGAIGRSHSTYENHEYAYGHPTGNISLKDINAEGRQRLVIYLVNLSFNQRHTYLHNQSFIQRHRATQSVIQWATHILLPIQSATSRTVRKTTR